MEPLLLSWMLDDRWLCTLRNPLNHYLLLLPVILDLLTVTGILVERDQKRIEVSEWIIILFAIYGILVILSLCLMVKISVNVHEQTENIQENQQMIQQFTTSFETKRNVWSWWGLVIIVLCIAQFIVNQGYIKRYQHSYACTVNIVRFWLDLACWAYLLLIILIFLVCKLCFLFVSWRNPEYYLRYKGVNE